MKITIDTTTLTLTPEEIQSLQAFADTDKQYSGVAHLIEVHLNRLVDHCLRNHPTPTIKATIEALQKEANDKVEAEIAKMRSARPLEAAKKVADAVKAVESEVVVSNL